MKAWVWTRGPAGFSSGPDVLEGNDAVVRIEALGIDVPLGETTRGSEWTDAFMPGLPAADGSRLCWGARGVLKSGLECARIHGADP